MTGASPVTTIHWTAVASRVAAHSTVVTGLAPVMSPSSGRCYCSLPDDLDFHQRDAHAPHSL